MSIAQNDKYGPELIYSEKKIVFGVKLQIWRHLGSNFELHNEVSI